MILFQLYAFVANAGWVELLSERWPDAPKVGEYRLLVFTNKDLPNLKKIYHTAKFKELNLTETINCLNNGEVGPFICSYEQANEVFHYFEQST